MSEKVAYIDAAVCMMCTTCFPLCASAAIVYDDALGVYQVDPAKCSGCGTCAAVCASGAARLVDRK